MFSSELPDDRQPVIVAARRSAVGRAQGVFGMVEAEDLAAPVLKAVMEETGAAADSIDDIILGNAAGGGGNIARLSGLTAGLPVSVPGVTVDRQCGAGLEAIVTACHLVAAGAGEFYLAGGVESVSRAPWRMAKPKHPGGAPRVYSRARFSPGGVGDPEMGVAAENVARRYGITRERQDALAFQSHSRAVASIQNGVFEREIVAITPKSGAVPIIRDECPRPDTSLERLARLSPVFVEDGTVTAGNSCPLNDGASVVAVTTLARAQELGISTCLAFAGSAASGVDPNYLGIGPVPATRKLLARQPDLSLAEAEIIEFNEAFAAQVLASLDELDLPAQRVNRDGGALAIGHPFGASGAILVTRIFSQMLHGARNIPDGALAFAMLGIGGGLGLSSAFRKRIL